MVDMGAIYSFKWLDNLIINKLSAAGSAVTPLNREEVILVARTLAENKETLPFEFLQKLLSLKNERQCKRLVNRYHLQFVLLREHIRRNLKHTKTTYPRIYELNRYAEEFVEYLLSLIEMRFPNYLRNDSPVSDTFRNITVSGLKNLLKKVKEKAFFRHEPIIDRIVIPSAISTLENKEVTFGQLNYWQEMLGGLLSMEAIQQISHFNTLEEFLINMNFNHAHFVSYLQQKILKGAKNNIDGRKYFREINIRRDIYYSNTHQSLHRIMHNWFTRNPYTPMIESSSVPAVKESPLSRKTKNTKVILKLSVDQYGILLRAADQTKLLDAPSFSHVCETMAPIFATANQEEISANSLRSNAYPTEENDKLVTIRSLEKMIRWIREC
jgi:hypothetical protein